jgi:hypothetical protein
MVSRWMRTASCAHRRAGAFRALPDTLHTIIHSTGTEQRCYGLAGGGTPTCSHPSATLDALMVGHGSPWAGLLCGVQICHPHAPHTNAASFSVGRGDGYSHMRVQAQPNLPPCS